VGLTGRRVLVAEDEVPVALDLQFMLTAAGCTVLGPAPQLATALRLAREEDLDAALLDVCLRGEFVFDAADALVARHVPFIFLTGYDSRILPERMRSRPICRKPCSTRQLLTTLKGILV
jgi:DNA-binding response OmpR family regulator